MKETSGKKQSRTFAMGDPHGGHIPLQQCLDRCGFDYENDTLINLGDICDGWPYVYECVEILLKIKNRVDLIGNHDEWFCRWLQAGIHPDYWDQGGHGTAKSYLRHAGKDENEYAVKIGYTQYGQEKRMFTFDLNYEDIPPDHLSFFRGQQLYYKDDLNRLFVHAGMHDRGLTLKENQRQAPSEFYWDRNLWRAAMTAHKDQKLRFAEEFSKIFIGHTPTTTWTTKEITTAAGIVIPKGLPITMPMNGDIIWNLDTGAGSTGRLTIMDVDSHEYWQSDPVNTIYGDYKPRG